MSPKATGPLVDLVAAAIERRRDISPAERSALLREVLADEQGSCPADATHVHAALIVAIASGLRPTTLHIYSALTWAYVPGEIWHGSLTQLGRDLGIGERAALRASMELRRGRHIQRITDRVRRRRGLILPVVEEALPADRRATPDGAQLRLPLLASIPIPTAVRTHILAVQEPAQSGQVARKPAQPGQDLAVQEPAQSGQVARKPAQPGQDLVKEPAQARKPAQPGQDLVQEPAQPGQVPSLQRARDPDPDPNRGGGGGCGGGGARVNVGDDGPPSPAQRRRIAQLVIQLGGTREEGIEQAKACPTSLTATEWITEWDERLRLRKGLNPTELRYVREARR